MQEKVGALIPEEDRIEITTLSENAFYYFGKRQLQNKRILIEDLNGAEDILYPLLTLQNKRRISKTVVHKNTKGETRTVHLKVEGPVSVSGCTTKESLYEDNANRSFMIYINESKDHTGRHCRSQQTAKRNTAAQIRSAHRSLHRELSHRCSEWKESQRLRIRDRELLRIHKLKRGIETVLDEILDKLKGLPAAASAKEWLNGSPLVQKKKNH